MSRIGPDSNTPEKGTSIRLGNENIMSKNCILSPYSTLSLESVSLTPEFMHCKKDDNRDYCIRVVRQRHYPEPREPFGQITNAAKKLIIKIRWHHSWTLYRVLQNKNPSSFRKLRKHWHDCELYQGCQLARRLKCVYVEWINLQNPT